MGLSKFLVKIAGTAVRSLDTPIDSECATRLLTNIVTTPCGHNSMSIRQQCGITVDYSCGMRACHCAMMLQMGQVNGHVGGISRCDGCAQGPMSSKRGNLFCRRADLEQRVAEFGGNEPIQKWVDGRIDVDHDASNVQYVVVGFLMIIQE